MKIIFFLEKMFLFWRIVKYFIVELVDFKEVMFVILLEVIIDINILMCVFLLEIYKFILKEFYIDYIFVVFFDY